MEYHGGGGGMLVFRKTCMLNKWMFPKESKGLHDMILNLAIF